MNHFDSILSNLHSKADDIAFDELISYAERKITPHEIGELAKVLAFSGTVLNLSSSKKVISDIPSTGGPSSLSTLLTPLFLKQFGFVIPKLGVPGRPAGGIDILAQINGFNINPDPNTIENWIESSGYVHFIGGSQYAPLDRKLFEYRKKKDKLDIPSLVIASILSKKIAVGLQRTGLDVRVSKFGNFGKNWETARENANLFINVASIIGIKASCFLTNADKLFQPYIGRGEALLAMENIFSQDCTPWIMNHVLECFAMAEAMVPEFENAKSLHTTLNIQKLETDFFENIELQGGSISEFKKLTKNISSRHQFYIYSQEEGFLNINSYEIRNIIVEFQLRSGRKVEFPDPCGLILKANQGDFVRKNTILCSYRCDKSMQKEFHQALQKAISVSETMNKAYQFEEIN